jgi:hypothetical protein
MPVRYVIDRERRLVVTTAWDRVTYAEVKAHQDQLLSDPAFNPEFDQLIDVTSATAWEIATDDLRMLARRKVFSPTSRRAWLATMPESFGLGRMAQAFHEVSGSPSEVCTFYDLSAALKWLGLTALPLGS